MCAVTYPTQAVNLLFPNLSKNSGVLKAKWFPLFIITGNIDAQLWVPGCYDPLQKFHICELRNLTFGFAEAVVDFFNSRFKSSPCGKHYLLR